MNPGRRIGTGIAIVVLLTLAGSAGYMLIEGLSFVDAFYMTVITITTVGYEEVKPLDTEGRFFTIVIIFVGVGTAYYVFAAVTEVVVGGQLKEFMGKHAMNRKIQHLEGHVILCGYGRFGRIVAEELKTDSHTIVVIETNPALEAELVRSGLFYLIGSALDENVLESAGIRSASDIVIATASDPDNVFISLTARGKNPTVRIHARAETEAGLRHLKLAGTDAAISSYQFSAYRIAASIARPSVVDFLTLVMPGRGDDVSLEEVQVAPRSSLIGLAIVTIERTNARLRIVGLKRGVDPISIIPDEQTLIEAGDLIVVIGARQSLARLAESAAAA
ncbi:MAG TPA: potassium channel protein [Candidatus Binataceae bacterium]|jgi:voltage-gated potassium channel|nr:potassium channel protein [Candidatus Binataceae bacterium]